MIYWYWFLCMYQTDIGQGKRLFRDFYYIIELAKIMKILIIPR
jgi:hypothetical protein